MNLTNQESNLNQDSSGVLTNSVLIQELKKRVREGTIEIEVTADQFKKETSSLLSCLGTKEMLLLVGLTVATVLIYCYSIKVTTSSPTGYALEFDSNPSITTIASEVQNEKP
jgi:hypothetical protein